MAFGLTFSLNFFVFIHRSNKTRIETRDFSRSSGIHEAVFIHRSNKTRIETQEKAKVFEVKDTVFIHRSNKTRIETRNEANHRVQVSQFLYIDPIKQGLKLAGIDSEDAIQQMFLYIDPIKQGLKHLE